MNRALVVVDGPAALILARWLRAGMAEAYHAGRQPDAGEARLLQAVLALARHGSATPLPPPPRCDRCGTPLRRAAAGRPRRYCSHACRQAAYEARH